MSAAAVEETETRRPGGSLFKQQKLPAWQPLLTPRAMIGGLFVVGLIFVPLGAIFLSASNGAKQVEVDYTSCDPNAVPNHINNCSVSFTVPQMDGPVYVYYQLTNYYQNHRRYVKSRNDAQLRGDPPTSWSKLEDCLPRIAVNDGADKSNRANWYLPCGLIAWSHFNDTFVLSSQSNVVVPWTKNGIAWRSDVDKKFRNPPPTAVGTRLDPPVDFEDEDFIVWMRTAGLPAFRKLHRVIPNGLDAGTYSLAIRSQFPVIPYGGTKSFIVSTVSFMGGRNPFLGVAYIVIGVVCLLLGIAFLVAQILFPRKYESQYF